MQRDVCPHPSPARPVFYAAATQSVRSSSTGRAGGGSAAHRYWPLAASVTLPLPAALGAARTHTSPKGLLHGFDVAGASAGIPLNLVQKWLG
jgi:hypothetical protein